jgi:hypothetical protein
MKTIKQYVKLANLLDALEMYDEAAKVDGLMEKLADLELTMEKEVSETKEDDDKDEDGEKEETKKKKITLSFD